MELDFMLGLLLGTVLGIIIMILATVENGASAEISPPKTDKNLRILPFVQIHQKLQQEANEDDNKDGSKPSKEKVDGFKLRNSFH